MSTGFEAVCETHARQGKLQTLEGTLWVATCVGFSLETHKLVNNKDVNVSEYMGRVRHIFSGKLV